MGCARLYQDIGLNESFRTGSVWLEPPVLYQELVRLVARRCAPEA